MSIQLFPKCSQCGAGLHPQAPEGLCPNCLMALNLKAETFLTGAADPQHPLPPEQIAPHFPQLEILECLGRGGMGVVYKARQKSLSRMVALKLLAPECAHDPQFAARFEKEALALAALNHPNIVTIYDHGRAGGFYYLLMEFVDGMNLRQLLNAGNLASEASLAIVPQICDALQYAHDRGIVHRDIKPENILIGKDGLVKIADFGVSKILATGISETTSTGTTDMSATLTGSDGVIGTPQYMAPEQRENPGEADHRADIYSLGVVFYQMLTGVLPDKKLEPPSRKVSIDVRLDEVVLRALEKEPQHRYQQVSEVKTMVETIVTTKPEPRGEKTVDINFKCPTCNEELAVEQSAAGEAVDCPSCGSKLTVPSLVAPPVSQSRAAKPPALRTPPPAPPPRPAENLKRARGLAIWSLVLGIIGVVPVLGLATGWLALVLGITALVKRTTSKGVAIAGTVLAAIAMLMIPLHLIVVSAGVSAARYTAGIPVCANNLKMIGVGIIRYQEQHGGNYPPNLNALVSGGLIKANALQCPLHSGKSASNDYEYAPPRGASTQAIIAWDRYPHSAGHNVIVGRNGLAADGSVRLLTEPQAAEIIKAVNVLMGTTPKPESPKKPVPPTGPTRTKIPPPEVPAMTVSNVAATLKSAPARDQRGLLHFLAGATVTPEERDAVIAAVKPLLNDVDNGENAFQVFVAWAGQEQVPDFIDFVKTAPKSSRGKESMKILSRLGDARAAAPIAAQLSDFFMVRDAKAALVAMGDIAKPAVLPLYHDENGHAREAARELLRGYHATDEEIFAESLKALGSEKVGAQRSAIDYLNTTTIPTDQREAVARALRPLVTINKDRIGDVARNAMKKVASKADSDFLLELMRSTDDATRWFAIELLVDFKDPRSAKPLAVLLADPQDTYRAGNVLIRFGSSAETAIIPNLKSADAGARKRAADILAKIGTAASLPALEAATKDKDFFAKAAAESARASIQARTADRNSGNKKIGF